MNQKVKEFFNYIYAQDNAWKKWSSKSRRRGRRTLGIIPNEDYFLETTHEMFVFFVKLFLPKML